MHAREQEPLLDDGSGSRKKHVVIIGAGAAGMVCSPSLFLIYTTLTPY